MITSEPKGPQNINKEKMIFEIFSNIIANDDNCKRTYSIRSVKIISETSNGRYMVRDGSGTADLPLIIDSEHVQDTLNINSFYDLLKVEYMNGLLLMKHGKSYAIELVDLELTDTADNGTSQFTTESLQKLNENNNIIVNAPLFMILKNSGKTKRSESSKTDYRKAWFKDEYKTVSLTAFGDDTKIFDSWVEGKIYKIQHFRTNRYTTRGRGDVEINMTWIQGKTKLEEISYDQIMKFKEDERSRIELLSNMKSEFVGRILNHTTQNYWNACKNCGKSVYFDSPTIYVFDSTIGKTIAKPRKCSCGILITETMECEKKYDVKLILDNENNESCFVVLTFSDQLAGIRNFMDNEHLTDKEFLESLHDLTVKIIFDERKNNKGKFYNVVKEIFLINVADAEKIEEEKEKTFKDKKRNKRKAVAVEKISNGNDFEKKKAK